MPNAILIVMLYVLLKILIVFNFKVGVLLLNLRLLLFCIKYERKIEFLQQYS